MGSFDFPSNLNQPDNAQQVFVHPAPPIVGRPKCFNCTLSAAGTRRTVLCLAALHIFCLALEVRILGAAAVFLFRQVSARTLSNKQSAAGPINRQTAVHPTQNLETCLCCSILRIGCRIIFLLLFSSVIAHLPSLQHLIITLNVVLSATF